MDEPTNDLDIETLELLEELLLDYPGTLLLVSHDREFLNNVVTSTLVLEGDGVVKEYAGGYDDTRQPAAEAPADKAQKAAARPKPARPPAERPRRLSYAEQRELKELPGLIESLEADVGRLHEVLADPVLYQKPGREIAQAKAELESLQQRLRAAYARWEALEAVGGD
jgi:ATP-binding cassette subfamily F protein uup